MSVATARQHSKEDPHGHSVQARSLKAGGLVTGTTCRVALVTGASSGIGAATARLLATRGTRVVVNYLRNCAAAEEVVAGIEAAGGQAMAVQADVREAAAVESMIEQVRAAWGGVDVLVHNALMPYVIKSFEDIRWEELGGKLEDEMRAAFVVTKAVLPAMTEHGWGRIIYLGTGLSRQPREGMIALGTAKAALSQFARYLALELGPRGVTVNVVEPGPVEDTRMSHVLDKKQKERQVAATPLGRLALPCDVAQAVAFYASEENAFMTGTTAAVNGGLAMY
jgi:3-oxoacyl-[acyl-carrier protein] reductase